MFGISSRDAYSIYNEYVSEAEHNAGFDAVIAKVSGVHTTDGMR